VLYVHSIKMPTKGQFSCEKNVNMLSSRDGQKKGHSQHEQVVQVPKERIKAVNRNIDGKIEDRVRVVKNDKFRRQREAWNTEMKGSKPWPGRKAATVDELVKHMSNVPSYLQCKGTADHLQDKALNVGVLEWGLLANWSQQQNHEPSRSHGVSPSNTSRSMLFSSPSHSSASPSSRSLESNQSTPMSDQHSSSKGQQSRLVDEHHGKARYPPSPNSAVLSLLPGHGKYLSAENNCAHGGPSVNNVSLPSYSVASSSGSCMQRERDGNKESRRKIEDAVHRRSRRLFTSSDNIGKNIFTSDNNDYMCNGPEQSSGLNGEHLESLISSSLMDAGRNGSRSPYGFLEDIEPSHEFPRVPYSCPLPIMDPVDELGTSGTAARNNVVDTSGTTGKNFNKNSSAMRVTKDPPQSSGKFSDVGRMPDRHLVYGMNDHVSHSCSLEEAAYARQHEVAASVDKTGDMSSSSSKGNRSRSPLRRMLDPILKPKQTSISSPIRPSFVPKCHLPANTSKQSLDFEGPVSQNVQRKSFDMIINSNYQAEANINRTPHVLLNSARYLQQERDSATTRQALLQLAWKNGLPLFMLSYGDSDILAATIRKRDIPEKDDLESTYAIFTVEEPKKKSGTWITTGGKNKKHQLVSSIVGEMSVAGFKSRCNCTKNVHVHREFVLVGSDLLPASEESGDLHVNREIAAFISAVPQQEAETSCQSSSQIAQKSSSPSGCCCPPLGNLQPSVDNSCTHSANVIAILPNGFHGTSTSGQPLPLIERWKSGGACDCGGWDEGCMLSVLTDSTQEKCVSQANQGLDCGQRFEFLVQVCIFVLYIFTYN
jgi:hypothetical protein